MSQHVERCAIYTRQSRTNDSAMSSCEAQRQICKDTAESFTWQVVDVFEDRGKSSETLMRPEMQRLIAGVEQGKFDRVIAYSIDRLTRRLYDLAKLLELLDRGSVALTVVTDPNFGDSAASRFTTNIVAAAAEFQQELTKERMAESRAALKSLKAWDIEDFVAKQIAQWDGEPELAKVFRDDWPAMVTEERQGLLKEFVVKIEYNADDGNLDFEMNEAAVARFSDARVEDSNEDT